MRIPSIETGRAGRLAATLVATLLLTALLPVAASAATAPTITSATSTIFTVGVAGSFTITATGDPTPTISESGTLPTGVTFHDNSTGTATLSGTPTVAGTFAITFTATNTAGTMTQNFNLVVNVGTAPTITSATTTTFTVGVPNSFTVTTTGVPTPSIAESGTLPSGVTFHDNSTGTATIAGTPAAGTTGSYPLTITASNGNLPNAVQNFTLVVGTGSAPTITSSSTTTFLTGVANSFTVTATGVPTPSIARSGATLPSGVTFADNGNGTGTLSGTPAAGTIGSYALTFTASNGVLPNAVQGFTLVVAAPGPAVTINQAAGQADPTATSPINFTVVFAAPVTGFTTGDVTISGTAGGTKVATVTGSGTTYNVAVSGMTSAGTVIATVPAGVAVDASNRPNLASTSTDNTVTWVPAGATITLTTSAPTPPGAENPVITWGQGFTLTVQFASNGAGKTVQLQGNRVGTVWTTITNLTMDSSGRASFFYTPITNLYYRAVFAGTSDLAAATSNQVRTVVRQIALLRPTSFGAIRSVARNTTVTFTTTVRPSRPELVPASVTYWVYRFVGGAWHLFSTHRVTAGSTGLATFTWTFSSTGLWYVRSMANPTPYNANSVKSRIERYRVV